MKRKNSKKDNSGKEQPEKDNFGKGYLKKDNSEQDVSEKRTILNRKSLKNKNSEKVKP